MSQILIRILTALSVVSGLCFFEATPNVFVVEVLDALQSVAVQVRIPARVFTSYLRGWSGSFDVVEFVEVASTHHPTVTLKPCDTHLEVGLTRQPGTATLELEEEPSTDRIQFTSPENPDFSIHPLEVVREVSELALAGDTVIISVDRRAVTFRSKGEHAAVTFRHPSPPSCSEWGAKTIQCSTRNFLMATRVLRYARRCGFHIVSNTLQITFEYDYGIEGVSVVDQITR